METVRRLVSVGGMRGMVPLYDPEAPVDARMAEILLGPQSRRAPLGALVWHVDFALLEWPDGMRCSIQRWFSSREKAERHAEAVRGLGGSVACVWSEVVTE